MPRPTLLSLLLLVVCLLATLPRASSAAPGDHVWSLSIDFSGNAGGPAAGPTGEVAVAGSFFGTADFGGGSVTATNFLGGDVFIVKYDAAGLYAWSRVFSPTGFGVVQHVVTFDPAGNLYLAGWLQTGTLDLGGGAITGIQGFIAKFDAQGNHLWSRGIGGGRPFSLDATATHFAIAGYKESSVAAGVDFGGGPIGLAGATDAVVGVLLSDGTHVWSRGFGDATGQGAFGVRFDGAGNVVLAGSMFGTVDFGGGARIANGLDVFLASFTNAGSWRWDRVFNGTFTPGGGILVTLGLDAGPSGDIALAGQFVGSVNFGGALLTSAAFSDAFVARFDSLGVHEWSQRYGSTGSDLARSVAFDATENLTLAGSFTGRTTFGGDTLVAIATDMFAAILEPSGAHLFSRRCGIGANLSAGVDGTGDADFSGSGTGLDFGGGPLADGLVIAKLEGASGGSVDVPPLTTESSKLSLSARPSPFRGDASIEYRIERAGEASVDVFDPAGRRIAALVSNRWHEAGVHRARLDAGGHTGILFVRLRAGSAERSIKVLSLRP